MQLTIAQINVMFLLVGHFSFKGKRLFLLKILSKRKTADKIAPRLHAMLECTKQD